MNFENWYALVNSVAKKYGYSKSASLALAAQGWLESGKLKSKLTTEFHNAFGMKVPSLRKSHRVGEVYMCNKMGEDCSMYSVYSDLEISIVDRIELDKYNFKDFDSIKKLAAVEYLKKIQSKGYATHPKYLELINEILSDKQIFLGQPKKGPYFLAILATLYGIYKMFF